MLFGRGFGDIIKASGVERTWSRWSHLPCGENHLAASLHSLNVIMSKTSRTERGDIEVAGRLP
jgi:hypothetical protein